MIKNILGAIAKTIVKNQNNNVVISASYEVYDIFDIIRNYKTNLLTYIFLYGLFFLSMIIILPGLVFYFGTFLLSVLAFLAGISFFIWTTIKIVTTLPGMIKEEFIERKARLNAGYAKIKEYSSSH